MQKKESFYAELVPINSTKWTPAPREFSTFTFCNRRCYLFGGLNYDTNNEVAQFRFHENPKAWANIKYDSNDRILGRCRHSACPYGDKIYIYGGCFMFNRKRQLRECTSQVLVYDTINETLNVLKTKGITVQQRKDHCSAIFGNSMIVYGGQLENGSLPTEMLTLDLQFHDWNYLYPKTQQQDLFYQAKCASVIGTKAKAMTQGQKDQQVTRMSDAIMDGVYYFGGKNAKGELLSTRLRFLKCTLSEDKVTAVEWMKIKQQGVPPCGRYGHTMEYLPVN